MVRRKCFEKAKSVAFVADAQRQGLMGTMICIICMREEWVARACPPGAGPTGPRPHGWVLGPPLANSVIPAGYRVCRQAYARRRCKTRSDCRATRTCAGRFCPSIIMSISRDQDSQNFSRLIPTTPSVCPADEDGTSSTDMARTGRSSRHTGSVCERHAGWSSETIALKLLNLVREVALANESRLVFTAEGCFGAGGH